ncbi:MAG TPA: CrcB family protein [Actinocrinis sp.]|nr:CrcB family protein [Actinocrinis sp.]
MTPDQDLEAIDGDTPLPIDPDIDPEPDATAGQDSTAGPDATAGPGTAARQSRTSGGHRPGTQSAILGAIALGGFAGGLARYGLGQAFPVARGAFPATTFAVNVSGSFILALLLVFVLEIWPPTRYLRPLLATGFCGAYTTFSTWMVDADRLIAAGRFATAAWYLFGSLAAGLAATSLGLTVGRAVLARRRRARERGSEA